MPMLRNLQHTPNVDKELAELRFALIQFTNTVSGEQEDVYLIDSFDNGRTCWAWFPAHRCFGVTGINWHPQEK
jgi:hypothetical protein